jgi:hypothetical protein
MSSPGSPTLIVETSHRTGSAAIAFVVGCGVLAPWLLDAASLLTAASASLVVAAALSLGFWQAGWCGGRRVMRMSWTTDGRWILTLRNGRSVELDLAFQTRVTPRLLWLVWCTPGIPFSRRAMLLSCLDIPPDDLRRLAARLRLDASTARKASASPVVVA